MGHSYGMLEYGYELSLIIFLPWLRKGHSYGMRGDGYGLRPLCVPAFPCGGTDGAFLRNESARLQAGVCYVPRVSTRGYVRDIPTECKVMVTDRCPLCVPAIHDLGLDALCTTGSYPRITIRE